jgi:hypothetical protein
MSLEDSKCLKCPHVPFVDLLRRTGDLSGGELYVLRASSKHKKFLPCVPGALLLACCRLWSAAQHLLEENEVSPFLFTFTQCLFDMKTSLFLAFTGHYTGAVRLLRPAVETAVTALWFSYRIARARGKRRRQAIGRFFGWVEGQYNTPQFAKMLHDVRDVLLPGTIESGEAAHQLEQSLPPVSEKSLTNVWKRLNEYLHPHYPRTDVCRHCADGSEGGCPASVAWNNEAYADWLWLYQYLAALLLRLLVWAAPGATQEEGGKDALAQLELLRLLRTENAASVSMCPELNTLMHELRRYFPTDPLS